MAAQNSERVHMMKLGFMELHNKGYTIPEIAEKFNLSKITVYRHLQEIADENGVTRESLLQVVKTSYSRKHWEEETRRETATFEILEKGFANIENEIDKLIETVEEELNYDIDN